MIGRDGEGRYELTEWGRKLATPVHELVRWGAPLMLTGQGSEAFRSRWLQFPLELMFGGVDPGRPDIQIEVRTADEMLTLTSTAGSVAVRTGPAPSPDVVVTGPPELIVGLMSGALDKNVAMSQGVSILGDFADVERLRRDWLDSIHRLRAAPRRREDFPRGLTSMGLAPRSRTQMVERTPHMTETSLAPR